MFTTTLLRNGLLKNPRHNIRFKSARILYNAEDYGRQRPINYPENIRVPKFKFPTYRFKPPGTVVEKLQENDQSVESAVKKITAIKPEPAIDVNEIEKTLQTKMKKPEKLVVKPIKIQAKKEAKAEVKVMEESVSFELPTEKKDLEIKVGENLTKNTISANPTPRAKNKVILVPMFLVFCALVDFAMDCYK